jgi:LuxR family maltose regulon positive regulatory protein
MNQIVLQRKLSIPSSGKLFTRPELIEKLNHYSQFPLTVITAPAGYGKTSLVCDWLQYAAHPVYWFSLDEQNNLPSSFWLYLCACLRKIDSSLDNKAEQMLENHFVDDYCLISDLVLTSLEKISRKWNRPTRAVIVLDDFQFIDHPLILKSFNRLLDYLPSWLSIVITARKSPGLMLPNRCSKSTAHIIQASELMFQAEHIADFLLTKLDLKLTQEQQQSLFEKTEGWAAAIQLTGLALKSGKSFEDCTDTHDSLLADFLFDEVFSQLNSELQTLLIDVSLVDHFNIELCQSFNSYRDNETILETLVTQGLFVSKIESSSSKYNSRSLPTADSHSFRLHSLFRQWILDNNPLTAHQIRHKQTITLAWLTHNHNYHHALELSLDLKDWQACAELMAQLYPSLIHITHFDHVSSILNRIPNDIIQSLPHLCLLAALINFSRYEYDKVEEYTHFLESFFSNNIQPALYTHCEKTSLIMGSMILRGQIARFTGQGEKARNINNQIESQFYADNNPLNCWVMLGKGVDCFFDDDITESIQYNRTALLLAKDNDDGLCVIAALSWLLHGLYHNGQITKAISLAEENINWLQQKNLLTLPNTSSVYAALSVLYMECNEIALAWRYYEELLDTLNDFTDPREIIYNKFHTHFHLLSSMGRYDEAHTCLQQLEQYENQLKKNLGPNFTILLDTQTLYALLEAKRGNRFPLLQLASNKHDEAESEKTNYHFRSLFEDMVQAGANMMMTSGEDNLFTDIASTSAKTGNIHRQVTCYLVPAKILFSLGQEQQALSLFQHALKISVQHQFINLVIDDEVSILPLIHRALTHDIEPAYCQVLLSAINTRKGYQADLFVNKQGLHKADSHQALDTYQAVNQGLVERLSPRELEVLRLINQGSRNKHIAENLSISLSTVKRHLQNIYQKLQVNSRTEAIAILNDRSELNI